MNATDLAGRSGRPERSRRWAMLFRDRREAGRRLASKLSAYAGRPDVDYGALPRRGAYRSISGAALPARLDVFLVRGQRGLDAGSWR